MPTLRSAGPLKPYCESPWQVFDRLGIKKIKCNQDERGFDRSLSLIFRLAVVSPPCAESPWNVISCRSDRCQPLRGKR